MCICKWFWKLWLLCVGVCYASRGCLHEISERPFQTHVSCDPDYPYRAYDGSCNNLINPTFGMAGSTFRRILPPKYQNDDGQTPRLTGVGGRLLPSARTVSATIHNDESALTEDTTLMTMQWSQFLSHDLTLTPKEPSCRRCCSKRLVTKQRLHRDITTGGPCFPIIVEPGDPYFDDLNSRCMEFTRSSPRYDTNMIRQQFNAVSAWIDASHVYGSTESMAVVLRSFTDGKLRVKLVNNQEFLPQDKEATEDTCFLQERGDYCFKAGDSRVNMFAGLSSLHTIILRYHNKICDRLKAIHGDWEDEKLYQEARRIVIAAIQRITYDEYLPIILGPGATIYHLLSGNFNYDSSIDATLSNVFSTAAYRFGHSMVKDTMNINGEIVDTADLFMRPTFVLNSMADIIKTLTYEHSEKADRYYSHEMTNRMFEKTSQPKSGKDIVAINIQRGRDHGLPPYNDWREHFGLNRKTFEKFDTGKKQYPKVFHSADDIDLYSGALSERPVRGAKVGELYSKILAQQFHDLKYGDRFWFENLSGITSFNKKQIKEIYKLTLSVILCNTLPDLKKIQPNAFRPEGPLNEMTKCSLLEDIDLEAYWA